MLHVYVVNVDQYDSAKFERLCRELPFGEAEFLRLQKIKSHAYKMQSLAGLTALWALLKALNTAPREIVRSSQGKPSFGDEKSLCFSISHTANFAVAAIADKCDGKVGIDIEDTDKVPDFALLARRFFGEQEYRDFVNGGADLDSFMKLWTRKEAYAKLHGGGLPMCISGTAPSDISFCTQTLFKNGKRIFLSACCEAPSTELEFSEIEDVI